MRGRRGIDVGASINSGQVFLWERHGGCWYGVDGQDVLRVSGSGRTGSLSGRRRDLFRSGDGIGRVLRSISGDASVARAVREYPGLRILRQDPFQCMVSFIASSNSSIQKIRSSLSLLARRLGEGAEYDSREFFLFPEPGRIARAPARELLRCGFGYRARYIREAARAVERGRVDLGALAGAGYGEARDALCAVPGIGEKVADCVMLFSLEKLEAFPLDRWMMRVLARHGAFRISGALTPRRYRDLHESLVAHFGPYAGYAQQFLFKAEREQSQGGWVA